MPLQIHQRILLSSLYSKWAYSSEINFCKFENIETFVTISSKKREGNITVVKKMKDYSQETVFKKKLENAQNFIEKHGLPGLVTEKKK